MLKDIKKGDGAMWQRLSASEGQLLEVKLGFRGGDTELSYK